MNNINKSKIFFATGVASFIVSMFVQMYITNIFAVKGSEVAKLKSESVQVQREISELVLKKSSLSTLSALSEQATKQGFIPMTFAVNTLHPVSVASLNSVTY